MIWNPHTKQESMKSQVRKKKFLSKTRSKRLNENVHATSTKKTLMLKLTHLKTKKILNILSVDTKVSS